MNRNKKGVMPEITREVYKGVKKFDRQQFSAFCRDLYGYGYEDGRDSVPGIGINDVMKAVAGTKGIGRRRLEDIRASIEAVFAGGKKDGQSNM